MRIPFLFHEYSSVGSVWAIVEHKMRKQRRAGGDWPSPGDANSEDKIDILFLKPYVLWLNLFAYVRAEGDSQLLRDLILLSQW